jgi:hypothetical protein
LSIERLHGRFHDVRVRIAGCHCALRGDAFQGEYHDCGEHAEDRDHDEEFQERKSLRGLEGSTIESKLFGRIDP